jgi:ribosomal protein S2
MNNIWKKSLVKKTNPLQIMDKHRKKSRKSLVQNLEAPERLKKAYTLVANLEPLKRLIVVITPGKSHPSGSLV